MRLHVIPLVARVALALLASAAKAEIFSVCTVMPTPDGFVALRDKPSATGGLIARMHPGEIAIIDVKGAGFVKSGGWVRISHYPGEVFPHPGDPEFHKVKRGWVKSKLVDECG